VIYEELDKITGDKNIRKKRKKLVEKMNKISNEVDAMKSRLR
jgi:hypothetical protein